MKRLLFFFLLFLSPVFLLAKYRYDETIFLPLNQDKWKIAYQNATENGACSTRYVPDTEDMNRWSKLLNLQFKDHSLINARTSLEAMKEEGSKSPSVRVEIIKDHLNDLIYFRSFPSGEQEIVRMLMTRKGLHRIAIVKKGKFSEEERKEWTERLMQGVIGHH